MCTYSRYFVLPSLVGMLIGAPTVAQNLDAQTSPEAAKHVILGSWTLNVDESTFHPGPPPKSQTRIYTAHPDGVSVALETVDADGKTRRVEYTANVDSLEYPVTGATNVDTIQLTPISARTAEAVLRHARKTIGTARRVISEDGRSLTITYKGTGRDGRHVEITALYEKKDDS